MTDIDTDRITIGKQIKTICTLICLYGRGHLILARGGWENWGGGEFFLPRSGVEYIYATLANIFNKWSKKAVFMKNN